MFIACATTTRLNERLQSCLRRSTPTQTKESGYAGGNRLSLLGVYK